MVDFVILRLYGPWRARSTVYWKPGDLAPVNE